MGRGFTARSEGRISEAVQYVERHYRGTPHGRRRRWHGAVGGEEFRRFELTENLTFGSNATAYLLEWTGSIYATNSNISFEVYDPFSMFNQQHTPNGQNGARGYARWCSDRRIWEIVSLQHQARWIKFIVNHGSGYDTGDLEWTVDGVEYFDGYEPSTAVSSVFNTREHTADTYKFEADDDDRGEAIYDPTNDKYWIVQMECP